MTTFERFIQEWLNQNAQNCPESGFLPPAGVKQRIEPNASRTVAKLLEATQWTRS
jgi:hypothetical protein